MANDRTQMPLFDDLPVPRKPRPEMLKSRIFFALWPNDATRRQIAAAAALIPPGSAARPHLVKPERYHLTLSFFGALGTPQVEAALKAAIAVQAECFTLSLDETGFFPSAHVAWIGPSQLTQPLAKLKAALDRELFRFGLPVESASFRPHVTCVRGLNDMPDAPPVQIDWPVNEFVLVRSILKPGNSHYKLLGRWPLQAVGTEHLAAAHSTLAQAPVVGKIV